MNQIQIDKWPSINWLTTNGYKLIDHKVIWLSSPAIIIIIQLSNDTDLNLP